MNLHIYSFHQLISQFLMRRSPTFTGGRKMKKDKVRNGYVGGEKRLKGGMQMKRDTRKTTSASCLWYRCCWLFSHCNWGRGLTHSTPAFSTLLIWPSSNTQPFCSHIWPFGNQSHSCCHSCHHSCYLICHHDRDTYAYSWGSYRQTCGSESTYHADATYQVFRQWRRRWHDFPVIINLQHLSREKQLIKPQMSVSLDIQQTLEHTLRIAPDPHQTVEEVLNEL